MGTSYEGIIVSAIGEFGLSQFLIVMTVKLSTAVVGWAMVMTSLIGAEPNWWKETTFFNTTSNISSISRKYKVCPNSANEVILFDDSIYTIVGEWNLICNKAWIPRTIMTSQMIGVLIGASIVGQFADWFGRKKSLMGAYIFVLLSVLAHGFSTNWHMMIGFAFILGFSIGGFLVCCNVFYLEFVGTKWRTITGSLPSWALGLMLLGGVFKLVPSWRFLCYSNVAVGCPILLLYRFCPESIRWLFAHGHLDKAKQTLEILAERNELPTPNLDAIDDILQEEITTERNQKLKYNYCTLFSNKFTRWKILIFGYIWFSLAFVYYAITFGVGTFAGDISINMVLQGLMEVVAVLVVLLMSKYSGRRWCSFLLILLTSLTLFGITIAFNVADTKTYDVTKTVLALISKLFVAASWICIMLFTIETFPTVVRNTAFGLSNVFARTGGVLAPQNIHLHNISSHLPFTFNGVVQLISALLCLCLRDTYATQLEDHFQEDEHHASNESLVPKSEATSVDETDQN